MSARVGITLQPDPQYLELLQPVFDEVDYFEVAPETTWRADGAGGWQANGYWQRFLDEGRQRGKPFVGHAVAASFGTADPRDRERQQRWLQRIAVDQEHFRFEWLTDHLGAAVLGEHAVALPVALPMTDEAAKLVRDRLVELRSVVPDVGFENSVFYFLLGDLLDEPRFFDAILKAPRTHLLLDLHNVHTMATNLGVDAEDYLARIDASRVIELHLSGGSPSRPEWLPDGRVLRLDSHDASVPEEVWRLFEQVLPRCTNLRGVTLERMEGTVGPDDVAGLRDEVRRIREVLARA